MQIYIRNVSKRFGNFTALSDINLQIESGELIALLGPSGSGKTTLLRIIGGLEYPDQGDIFIDGRRATNVPVRLRRVGFVFQNYALFRRMNVFRNIAFGLQVLPRHARPAREEIQKSVRDLLRLVQLEGVEHRYPAQLSGGQRQRVALARALAIKPRILLLDEPFGALDAKVRKELRRWVRSLHDELKITTVFVTHDQEEALEISDRVVVMNHSRLEQVGTPQQIYDEPSSPFVCEFVGRANPLQIVAPDATETPPPLLTYVRPHEIEVSHSRNGAPAREAIIEHVHSAGAVARIVLRLSDNGEILEADLPRSVQRTAEFQPGDHTFVTFRRTHDFSNA